MSGNLAKKTNLRILPPNWNKDIHIFGIFGSVTLKGLKRKWSSVPAIKIRETLFGSEDQCPV